MFYKNQKRKSSLNTFIKASDKYWLEYIYGKICNIFFNFCQQSNWKNEYSRIMLFLLFFCCLTSGLGLVHNRRVLHGAPWIGYDFHTYPHPGKMPIVAREVMVNVVNSLGLKLLAIHNEHNEDNIAISPYGALSILVALGEGLQGEAVRELQNAAHIPNDISVIRIGLRDIHRHLQSYFIPPEGFLAGLTLNHDNVTLKPEYEDILKFYGFDIMSFNSALYPNPPTTQYTPVGTVEVLTVDTTKTTVLSETTTLATETTASTFDPETTTTEPISTTTETIYTTYTTAELPMNDINVKLPTETTSSDIGTTTDITTTTEFSQSIRTIKSNLETTTEIQSTTRETTTTQIPTTVESTTPQVPTVTISTTNGVVYTTTEELTTIKTSTDAVTTTTEIITDVPTKKEIATTDATEPLPLTTEAPVNDDSVVEVQSTETSVTETLTTEVKATEASATEETTSEVKLTEPFPTTDETEQPEITTEKVGTSEVTVVKEVEVIEIATTNPMVSETTTTQETTSAESTEQEMETTSLLPFPYPDASTPEPGDDKNEDENTVVKRNIHLIKLIPPQKKNKVRNPLSVANSRTKQRRSKRSQRKIRSVVDYMIARYYDNHQHGVPYVPQTRPSFLVQGKYREYKVEFMKYVTVLPFFYVAHLKALALSFPLDSPRYYLLLLLPLDDDGVDQLICDLRLNGSFKYIIDNLRYRHVAAVIPSFLLKGYVNLTPTFQKLGIRRVFEPRQADFSPMTNLKDIYITNIEQAITVNIKHYVDLENFSNNGQYHPEAPIEFRADHPFVYFVVDSEFHVVLMTGKVVNPLNTRIT